jgi:hypothetical protein
MRISGNITTIANSTLQQDPGQQLVLYGPNTTAKRLSIGEGGAVTFADLVLDNQANMTTANDFRLNGAFIFKDAISI